MTKGDRIVERGSEGLRDLSEKAADRGGVAEKLARDGCKVRLCVDGLHAGQRLPFYVRDSWNGILHKLGVEVTNYARLYGVDGDTVYFQHATSAEPMILEGIDTVVTALGHRRVADLETELVGWEGELHLVGDCATPRTAEEAVLGVQRGGLAGGEAEEGGVEAVGVVQQGGGGDIVGESAAGGADAGAVELVLGVGLQPDRHRRREVEAVGDEAVRDAELLTG